MVTLEFKSHESSQLMKNNQFGDANKKVVLKATICEFLGRLNYFTPKKKRHNKLHKINLKALCVDS